MTLGLFMCTGRLLLEPSLDWNLSPKTSKEDLWLAEQGNFFYVYL